MSRKEKCLNNASVESFFHLFKTELLAVLPSCKGIAELTELSQKYVQYFNVSNRYQYGLKFPILDRFRSGIECVLFIRDNLIDLA